MLAAIALAGLVRSWWRRTLGRRSDRYARLARLGTGAQLSFFTAVLGEPPAIRRKLTAAVPELIEGSDEFVQVEMILWESFFIDRDYYVQTLTDETDTVVAFSVTTRHATFRPTFYGVRGPSRLERIWLKSRRRPTWTSLFKVRLGHTRFANIETWTGPEKIKAFLGARPFGYSERYYFGNPGYYLHYVFTASSAAGRAPVGPINEVVDIGDFEWPSDTDMRSFEEVSQSVGIARMRRDTAVTTYTVIGDWRLVDSYPTTYGPQGDEVRVLP